MQLSEIAKAGGGAAQVLQAAVTRFCEPVGGGGQPKGGKHVISPLAEGSREFSLR